MGKLIFELTEEDRAALERVRVEMGARSHAEALRRLIRSAPGADPALMLNMAEFVSDFDALAPKPSSVKAPARASVPTLQRKAFNPQPKTGKKR